MPAIRVAQPLLSIDIFGKEEGGVGALGRILVSQIFLSDQSLISLGESPEYAPHQQYPGNDQQ